MRLDFRFDNIRVDGPLRDRHDVLLRIEAKFVAEGDGVVVLEEPHFAIVEFAAQLSHWLARGASGDFNYESSDAEEIILWFRRSNGTWDVGTDWKPDATRHGFLQSDFETAAARYVRAVRDRVRHEVGRDIRGLLELPLRERIQRKFGVGSRRTS